MSTWPHHNLFPDATMASVFLLPTAGSQIIYLRAKENSEKKQFFSEKIVFFAKLIFPLFPHLLSLMTSRGISTLYSSRSAC